MSSEEPLPPDSAAERAPELPQQAGAGQAWPVQDAPGQELAPSLQAINQPGTPEHPVSYTHLTLPTIYSV